MAGLRQELSAIGPLIAFDAAARQLSFTGAADELGMTRVAISRQISALEADLKVSLFRRQHRGVALTAAGERLFEKINQPLRELAAAKQQIRTAQHSTRVNATMTVAFATFWLIPRLGSFRVQNPEIDLRLTISDKYLNLSEDGIDVAVRYGSSACGNHQSHFLFKETLIPVCSPTYARRTPYLSMPAQLLGERLIHLGGMYRSEAKWPNWFRSFGLALPPDAGGISVDAYSNMVQAALEGQGIALCGTPLVDHLLASGALVRALDVPPLERDCYFLVLPLGSSPTKATECFCEWILAESAGNPLSAGG